MTKPKPNEEPEEIQAAEESVDRVEGIVEEIAELKKSLSTLKTVSPEDLAGIAQQLNGLSAKLDLEVSELRKSITDLPFAKTEEVAQLRESLQNAENEQKTLSNLVRKLVEQRRKTERASEGGDSEGARIPNPFAPFIQSE